MFLEVSLLNQTGGTMGNTDVKVGEKIKNYRESQGLSLGDLAERTGFSTAYLSQLETHLISPPLGALMKIARSLDIETGKLFGQMGTAPFTIVRKDERVPTSRVASKEGVRYGYSYESLAPDKINRSMEPFLVTLEPVAKKGMPYSHDGEEFLFVLEGRVEIQLGEHTDILVAGDSIYYDSTLNHRVACADEKPAKIIAVIRS
jgi:transcriptional regulator with XRE-family HTH domain